ncbi:hypothetical protein KFK09_014818 [Dendrobium nobile]|uniref:Uncharacterized protein n=1 Tax=Dendrobium nobile TaxID=94219 RepID=A0A8T3B4F3_DENNO|nr:hypothetical protein KFK09_014818 [Dendrobium nobile]
MVSPSSRRMIGNVRSFVGNSLGGLRGWSNLASWAVAGTLAYFLWVKPARELKAEQDTGLIYGKRTETKKPQN